MYDKNLELGKFIKLWTKRKEVDKDKKTRLDRMRKIAVDYVVKNKSGLMSAMIKSIRMQKMNHAIYYGWLLLLGKQSPWYIGRRVLISGCEDGNDQELMKYLIDYFENVNKMNNFEILKGVIAICISSNWWNCEYGMNLVKTGFRKSEVEEIEILDIEEAKKKLMECIEKGGIENFRVVMKNYDKVLDDMNITKRLEWLIEIADKKYTENKEIVDLGKKMLKISSVLDSYEDENWIEVYGYMVSEGLCKDCMKVDNIEQYSYKIDKIYDIAFKDFLLLDYKVPSFAKDGMHTGKNSWGGDRRFAGTGQGFYNVLLMKDAYDRVDPRDQSLLDGCQVPEEGLVLDKEWLENI